MPGAQPGGAEPGVAEAGGADPGSPRVLLAGGNGEEGQPVFEARLTVVEAVERLLARNPMRVPSKSPLVLFAHRDAEQPLMFGRWFGRRRAPVVLLEAMADEVAEYLRGDPLGPFADLEKNPPTSPIESTWSRWGFQEDEKENTLKADWLSVPHLGARSGMFVPRHAEWRTVMRAPPRIAAFVMAFRAVNQPCWSAIVDALTGLRLVRERESEAYREDGRGKLLGVFTECFRNQRHFGIVEAQVRFGAEGRQPSHKDGATSLLHLGFTLGGRRTLRAGLFPAGDCPGNVPSEPSEEDPLGENNVWDDTAWKEGHLHFQEMVPGNAYLSSPFCFQHAVRYETCSPQEPIIALMCRWGFPEDLGKHINEMRTDDMLDITTVIAHCLKTASGQGQLRVPSLEEVRQGEARLRRIDADRAEQAQKQRQELDERRRTPGARPNMTYAG